MQTLNDMFTSQMKSLRNADCPRNLIKIFEKKRKDVVLKAKAMVISSDNLPFIPVIPRESLGIGKLIKMIKHDFMQGYTLIEQHNLSDVVKVPRSPYFIFDIENGKGMFGKAPSEAEKLIKNQGRRCLTAEEGISLCVHTNVLAGHFVDCVGSRVCESFIPNVCILKGKPKLHWYYADNSILGWGTASCSC